MKKLLTAVTAALLCMTLLVIGPAQMIASAAESDEKKYISEVKVGMGETSDEASKELLDEGYTILKDDSGNYADLNYKAGSDSPMAPAPRQKIVYLGYKTTGNANNAVTDLAVMNMNGGYDFQDYKQLMDKYMDTQIKPFVDKFISTLNEYRENLNKPKDSVNYKRANYFRSLLNKLTDDDTGGKPLGDLLVNQTKYELGDEGYNKLSDAEKKNHCDIITLLMQGNGQAIQFMETLLTRASDSSDNTWVDRFLAKDLKALTQEVKKENPTATPTDINIELDKKYNDDAKKILEKWSSFNSILMNTDNDVETAEQALDFDEDLDNIEKNAGKLTDDSPLKEKAEVIVDMADAQTKNLKSSIAAEKIMIRAFLGATKYGKGTLLEFFERDARSLNNSTKIRDLYPIVDSLSAGQLAGLDFISIAEMISMAIPDANGIEEFNLNELEPVSIFYNVNREIYEPGGVALTRKALRIEAAAKQEEASYSVGGLGKVLIAGTVISAFSSIISLIKNRSYNNEIASITKDVLGPDGEMQGLVNTMRENTAKLTHLQNVHATVRVDPNIDKPLNINEVFNNNNRVHADALKLEAEIDAAEAAIKTTEKDIGDLRDRYAKAIMDYGEKSRLAFKFAVGFAVVTAILATATIITTIMEAMRYYQVDFAPIPKYIVEENDITATRKKSETEEERYVVRNETAYYKVVPCNRKDSGNDHQKKIYKVLLDRADLNGDVGRQWLALYSVKYRNGKPILADSLKLKTGGGDAPEGYTTGIHMFGDDAVQNLTDFKSGYSYNDPNKGTYVFFLRDEKPDASSSAAGSLFSGGPLAAAAVLGAVAGGGLMALLVFSVRKRRENAGNM